MPIKLMKKPAPIDVDVYDIHVKFDAATFNQIEALAREEDRPLSAMVRRIVCLWLKGEPGV